MKKQRKKNRVIHQHGLLLGAAVILAVPFALFALPLVTQTKYETKAAADASQEGMEVETESSADTRPVVEHLATPQTVRAVYMTACVAGTPSFRDKLISLIEETELNAVVIDIKDYSGTISFPTGNPLLAGAWENARCGTSEMQSLVEELHARGIYVIGRITVFQDPYYLQERPDLAVRRESDGGVWKDYKGLSFIDVGAKEYWDYIIALAQVSFTIGFDELNFDYVRFPSDGNMKDIAFTHTSGSKQEQLEKFFSYLHEQLSDTARYADVHHERLQKPVLSVDLFGMTTTNTDDLNIGQVLERALPYFDYVAPMVYPSHYPSGFNGWTDPNKYPYDLIHYVMRRGVERTVATSTVVQTLEGRPIYDEIIAFDPALNATTTKQVATGRFTKEAYDANKLRPWIQDFDYGGDYDVAEVKAQIQASYDVGLNSWMLWAPSNIYTRGALESAP